MTSTPSDPWGTPPSPHPQGPVTPDPADPFSGDPYAHNPFTPAPHTPGPPAPYSPGGRPPAPHSPEGRTAAYPPGAQPVPPDPYPPAAGPAGPVIVQVGEIRVTSSVVHTPAGDIPLAGSTWQVSDYWHAEQRIPRWAIVCAIVGFCVLTVFSLLFLLVKETISRGTVQVTVTNGAQQYVARIPVTDQNQVSHIHQQVNYIRSLAAL